MVGSLDVGANFCSKLDRICRPTYTPTTAYLKACIVRVSCLIYNAGNLSVSNLWYLLVPFCAEITKN
jgi:hypothetical protein